ncbi:hypothetical protein MY1884_006291 [Beauveria asiatica]
MAELASHAPPFSILLLEQHAVAFRDERDQLLTLLPASYRKESSDLAAAGQHVATCVEEELDLRRLTSIQDWLWVAGMPLPPRALHHQLLLGWHASALYFYLHKISAGGDTKTFHIRCRDGNSVL